MNNVAEAPKAVMSDSDSPIIKIYDQANASVSPRKPFVVASRQLTYGQLFDQVARLATFYEELGLTFGDRVVIASDVDVASGPIFISLLRSGITGVVLDPGVSEGQLRLILGTVEPKAVFLDRSIIQGLANPVLGDDGIRVIEIALEPNAAEPPSANGQDGRAERWSFPGLLENRAPISAFPKSIPDSLVAYILFTSGTTSRPKGVEITHRALFAHMRTLVRQFQFDEETRLLNIIPFQHTDGLTHGLTVMLAAAGSLIRPFRLTVDRLYQLLDCMFSYRVTHFVTTPALLSMIAELAADRRDAFTTDDFRFVISTASALDANLWANFEETFGTMVVNSYGLTEITNEALYSGPDEATRKIGTVGKPVDCEAKVIDEQGNGVPAGEIGELILRGEHLMKGYFRMPEETAAVLKNGWLHTGDLAVCDADGFFQIVGRKKNVIIRAGFNVYPEEITGVLRSMPRVIDAATIGVEDAIFGERVVSCIVPAPGAALTESDVATFFLQHASKMLLPNEIYILDDLPRGPAGKVVIEELKRIVKSKAQQPRG